ncbi:hypothetical protein F8M41_025843 [Gigaspora margarita]|uniref:Uncharacterized protein n=1 Tax=Gigaspora margarita TaxID=4874 RepID=A0A8H3XIN3_GIGMA|nr:hypothetical protein F8M41_025843 [Gigaspora margarita]
MSEEQLLCKRDLRTISFSTPISEEQRQELEGKCLCQTHYNHEVVNKNYYQKHQTKLKEYCSHPTHKLDSTTKICHRCIKFTDQDPDYITSNDYNQAIK